MRALGRGRQYSGAAPGQRPYCGIDLGFFQRDWSVVSMCEKKADPTGPPETVARWLGCLWERWEFIEDTGGKGTYEHPGPGSAFGQLPAQGALPGFALVFEV